nr:hypothetical protein [Tanacetum cinerariifolium]
SDPNISLPKHLLVFIALRSPKTQFRSVFVVSQGFSFYHFLRLLRVVIEFEDSYTVPVNSPSTTTTDTTSGDAGTKSGKTVTLTAEDMQKKKNDAAILKTFDGNEAAKKTKKNLLKQQYGNFIAEGSETLEQTSTEEMRAKFLEHGLYLFRKHNSRNKDGNTAFVPTASASVATINQETACAYIASQSSGSQIKFEDINQIDKEDMEEMDIKWNMALLSMRVDKAPRNQERGRRDNYRQWSKAKEQAPKELMAIDGVG